MTGKQKLAAMKGKQSEAPERIRLSPEEYSDDKVVADLRSKYPDAILHVVEDIPVPVQFLFFKEPQRLPGSQSASSLTSYTDAKTSSRHTIDWLPSENQFRIVYHPANHPTETRYIFPSSISNYARFDPGETYGLPHGSALRPKE